MVIAATDDLSKITDTLVWNNLEFAKSEVGGYVGSMKNWDQYKPPEKVRIVGHGKKGGKALEASGTLYNADDIKNEMKAAGFDVMSKPDRKKELTEIEFQSCFAAQEVTGKATSSGSPPPVSSLISDMAQVLEDFGQSSVIVRGRPGVAFGFKGMEVGKKKKPTATLELTSKAYAKAMKF